MTPQSYARQVERLRLYRASPEGRRKRQEYSRYYRRLPRVREREREAGRRYSATPKGRAKRMRGYAKARVKLDAQKAKPCWICGERFPPECMDFNHVRGKKSFDIGTAVRKRWDKMAHEIAKCEVFCANCHRTWTLNEKKGWKT